MAATVELIELGAPKPAKETTAGNYFVSNYPPFSFWEQDGVTEALAALDRPAAPGTPLGVYLHVPFCRKRCHFCYFRVYTDKNSDDIGRYLEAALAELRLYAQRPFINGRKPKFVYVGGGTPSYLSVRQLTFLTDAMKEILPWDEAEEVTFECEPGTLTEPKLQSIRQMGVTRLSLGVEHFVHWSRIHWHDVRTFALETLLREAQAAWLQDSHPGAWRRGCDAARSHFARCRRRRLRCVVGV